MQDPFAGRAQSAEGPSRALVTIAPNDNQDLPANVRQIELSASGTAGNVAVVCADNADGEIQILRIDFGLPITGKVIRRVRQTGTTAGGLIGSV